MQEKNYSENTAKWMAQHLEALLDYMQYGHAVIAFYKQNGKFKFVKATLRYYEAEFHKKQANIFLFLPIIFKVHTSLAIKFIKSRITRPYKLYEPYKLEAMHKITRNE